LSFRAKHPDDLREKLQRKSEERDDKYTFEALSHEIGEVVTDLAGCRVVVYTVPDEERVSALVRRIFTLPDRVDAKPPPIRRPSGYQATHTLVLAPEVHDDTSIHGTICEVQVATVAAHLFNELEHDITYKKLGHLATPAEQRLLSSVERACKLADHLVEQLLDERARGKAHLTGIADAAELRLALERATARPLNGDFARLFTMLVLRGSKKAMGCSAACSWGSWSAPCSVALPAMLVGCSPSRMIAHRGNGEPMMADSCDG